MTSYAQKATHTSLAEATSALTSGQQPRSMLDWEQTRSHGTSLVASLGTLGVHLLVLGLASFATTTVVQGSSPALISELVEVELPAELNSKPEPESKPEPPQPPPSKAAAQLPAKARSGAEPSPAPAPPAVAAVGQVLAANEDVVDFKDSVVTGTGANYAGGPSAQAGTSKLALRDSKAPAGGAQGATGNGAAPAADLSRPPALAGGANWDCPFPFEAEDRGIEQAVVSLRVEVAASGEVVAANVTRDPGTGFGREARRCALRKHWSPGLDRLGRPISAVAQVNVRFQQQ